MEIKIRAINQSDNVDLARIIRSAFHDFNAKTEGTVYVDPTTDNLWELFQKLNSCCYVAEVDGMVAGCCGIYPTKGLPEGCVELVKFYLKAEFRGKGIGKRLLGRCTEAAIQAGYQKIYIESLPEFSNAVKLYLSSGFNHLQEPLGESGHYGCNIWMLKLLNPLN